jgi:phage-related protein
MGSVAQTVGDFVGDTVSSVGDIGASVIDAGSDVVESVGDGLTAATQAVSDAFEATGAAVLDVGEAVDRTVNDVIPGGWYMVAAVAATVATAGTVNLEGEALAAAGTGEVVANSVLNIYGSLMRAVDDSCSVKNSKNNLKKISDKNNKV